MRRREAGQRAVATRLRRWPRWNASTGVPTPERPRCGAGGHAHSRRTAALARMRKWGSWKGRRSAGGRLARPARPTRTTGVRGRSGHFRIEDQAPARAWDNRSRDHLQASSESARSAHLSAQRHPPIGTKTIGGPARVATAGQLGQMGALPPYPQAWHGLGSGARHSSLRLLSGTLYHGASEGA
ncbi:hypothetical protein AQB9606_04564 [Aquabacterium sp. CECT 9606]|nr:hypothetical protein AQB9606_04564 [Aquabacterium sp. CECT 9606]